MKGPSPTSPSPKATGETPSRPDSKPMIELTWRRWRFGRKVSRLMETAKARRPRFGPAAPSLRKVAAESRLDPDLARVAYNIFKAFPTEEALKALLARLRKDGRPLSCTTLALLCRPTLKARREALIERVLEENMGEDQLKDLIRDEADRTRKRLNFGRTPKPPASLTSGLRLWEREARRTSRYTQSVFDEATVWELVRQAPDSGVTVDAVEGVERALAGAIEAMARQLTAVIRIKAAVAARGAGRRPHRVADRRK
jgi:hypothetical protein